MAISSAALAAWETADLAKDYPILGPNAIPVSPSSCIWSESGNVGATDRTLTGYPTKRAWDGYPDLVTTPDTTATATWYLVFDFGAGGINFDFVAVNGHNWNTAAVDDVYLQMDSAGTFNSGPGGDPEADITLLSSPADDLRFMELDVHHTGSVPLRYSSIRYLRLKFTHTGNFTTEPTVGSLFLGRRRQMHHMPNIPYDKDNLHKDASQIRTAGGVTDTTVWSERRFDLHAEFTESEDTYKANIKAFARSCRSSFVWIFEPSTAPDSWHQMELTSFDFDFPVAGWTEQTAVIEAIEQGPESYYLDQEEN